MTHSIEEINELKSWFDSVELPTTMNIDKATYTSNLKGTVEMLFEQACNCCGNPRMQGCILLLKKIKANLEKQ